MLEQVAYPPQVVQSVVQMCGICGLIIQASHVDSTCAFNAVVGGMHWHYLYFH